MSIQPIHEVPLREDRTPTPDRTASELQEFLRQSVMDSSGEPLSLRAWLDLAEAWKITRTLRECRGNRSATARALGIGRRTLYAKMDKLQITPTWAVGGHPLDE